MKFSFLPKSRLGIWSAGLGIFSVLVCVVLFVFSERAGVIASETAISITAAVAAVASIVAFVIGLIAMIKHEDRSVLILFSVILGFIIIFFLIADIVGGLLLQG